MLLLCGSAASLAFFWSAAPTVCDPDIEFALGRHYFYYYVNFMFKVTLVCDVARLYHQ